MPRENLEPMIQVDHHIGLESHIAMHWPFALASLSAVAFPRNGSIDSPLCAFPSSDYPNPYHPRQLPNFQTEYNLLDLF